MSITFNCEFPEPSRLVGFGQNNLIRDAENRDNDCLSTALNAPNAGYYAISDSGVIINNQTQSPLLSRSDIEKIKLKTEDLILLGESPRGPRLAIPSEFAEETTPSGFDLMGIRSLLYHSEIDENDTGAIAQGASLLAWYKTNQYCGICGSPSNSKIGGYRRDCQSCDHKIFPRTDPAVIMLAIKDNKCLLGRSPHFPEYWYSTLAGFVEPGETIEDAVRREVFEESGIAIKRVQYFASQPWPFPHSLMIGVHCEAISENITIDESELEDCRWFDKNEVKQMIADQHPNGYRCPPTKAIAHAIIKAWID